MIGVVILLLSLVLPPEPSVFVYLMQPYPDRVLSVGSMAHSELRIYSIDPSERAVTITVDPGVAAYLALIQSSLATVPICTSLRPVRCVATIAQYNPLIVDVLFVVPPICAVTIVSIATIGDERAAVGRVVKTDRSCVYLPIVGM